MNSSRSLVPVEKPTGLVPQGFRLTLERLPGNRVQTGLIDVEGAEFQAWRRSNDHADSAVEFLARELARHLNVPRDAVSINEYSGPDVMGERRFRLIAFRGGKPPESTDAVAAWRQWRESGNLAQLPDYIDIA